MNDVQTGHRFLLLLLAGSAILTFFIFWPFFAPLVFAVVFAVVLQPVYTKISRSLGNWPSTAALLTVLFAIFCILLPLGFLITSLAAEAREVYISFVNGNGQAQIQNTVLRAEHVLQSYFPGTRGLSDTLSANIATYSQEALRWILEHVAFVFSGVASLFVNLFVFFVALYYLLRDGAAFKRAVIELSPLPDSYDEVVARQLGVSISSVVTGSLLVGIIQGVLAAIGFGIFGVSNAVLWGAVAAVAALVPGVGTGLVFGPAVILLLLVGDFGAAVGIAAWGAFAVGMVDNFLGPRLLGRHIDLHPFFMLLSVFGGISFFGILGLFLGPIFLSFLFTLLSIYATFPKRSES